MAFVDRSGDVDMESILPNLKIELHNDDDIAMETDEEDNSSVSKLDHKSQVDDTEEGELVDCKDEGLEEPVFDEARPLSRPTFPISEPGRPLIRLSDVDVFSQTDKRYENQSGGFVTGVNIFSPEEQEKLTKRAERFGIDPSESKSISQKVLQDLYKSMGVTPGDINNRLDALHVRGTEDMNTQDVFGYFKDYAPASIEWISTFSCNVMWLDEISAARALLGLSLKIKDHQKESKSRFGREREKRIDESENGGDSAGESEKQSGDDSDAVSVSDINVTLPPGKWRKGVAHPKASCIFLRFATRQDRRTPQLHSKNHDFDGYVGLISESKKRRFQEALGGIVFYDTGDEVVDKSCPNDSANPWASLAYRWGAFDRNRNKIRHESPPKRPTPPPSPVFMSRYDRPVLRQDIWDLKKRQHSFDMDSHSSESEDWIKRRKIPRMRMHADDEVIVVEKRLGQSHSEKHRSKHRPDLRRHLDDRETVVVKREKKSSSPAVEEEQESEDEVPDLRIAVAAERSPSPEDNKEDIWRLGGIKSVLRGARAHDSGSDEDRRVRSSVRKHRSRSRERHHRRRRKESSRYRSKSIEDNKREEEYDSDEVAVQPNAPDLRAKIGRKKHKTKDSDHHHRSRHRRHHDHDHDHDHDHHSSSTTFRPKSPLQIEIDNDEYYKLIESE